MICSVTGCLPFLDGNDELKFIVCRGDYNKDNLNNNHVSEAAKDLIDRLLQVDPEKRISVEEVANTPFLDS